MDWPSRELAAAATLRPARPATGVRFRLRGHAHGRVPPRPSRQSDHIDGRRQQLHPGRAPTQFPARGVHVDRVRIGHGSRDWQRFTGSTIGAYLGLVPTEHSPCGSRSQGSITKTGNTHARRLLVEAACHHRNTYPQASVVMQARWALASPAAENAGPSGQSPAARPVGGQQRQEKKPVVANVPVARGTARVVLVVGHDDRVTPPPHRRPGGG